MVSPRKSKHSSSSSSSPRLEKRSSKGKKPKSSKTLDKKDKTDKKLLKSSTNGEIHPPLDSPQRTKSSEGRLTARDKRKSVKDNSDGVLSPREKEKAEKAEKEKIEKEEKEKAKLAEKAEKMEKEKQEKEEKLQEKQRKQEAREARKSSKGTISPRKGEILASNGAADEKRRSGGTDDKGKSEAHAPDGPQQPPLPSETPLTKAEERREKFERQRSLKEQRKSAKLTESAVQKDKEKAEKEKKEAEKREKEEKEKREKEEKEKRKKEAKENRKTTAPKSESSPQVTTTKPAVPVIELEKPNVPTNSTKPHVTIHNDPISALSPRENVPSFPKRGDSARVVTSLVETPAATSVRFPSFPSIPFNLPVFFFS